MSERPTRVDPSTEICGNYTVSEFIHENVRTRGINTQIDGGSTETHLQMDR